MSYTWDDFLNEEKEKDYYKSLMEFVNGEYETQKVYPPRQLMFNAFSLTPFDKTRVIILGQDPYHNPYQAMGLAFSVPEGIKLPPSLVNIYKEIEKEYGFKMNYHNGDLTYLARQGVLLLNTLLSVRENQPMSHKGHGYETLIENAIRKLDEDDNPKVFILWGNPSKKIMPLIKNPKHLILTSAHPSPLSAYQGFFGNNHFKKCNEFLEANSLTPIEWKNENECTLF